MSRYHEPHPHAQSSLEWSSEMLCTGLIELNCIY